MQILRARASIALLTLALSPAFGATIKKWVDENGVTHYGTSIPPEYVQKEHVELNDRGITVKKVDRAPTPEEIARQRELEALRKAQAKIVQEQRARDQVLLNMFRTEDDLIMTRDGKLAQIDAQIKVKKARIEALKRSLSKWQAKAAARERKGRKPTPQQIENLENIQKQLESTYAGIVEQEAQKQRIATRYAYQLQRFRKLKQGFRAKSADDVQPRRPKSRLVPVEGAYPCRDEAQCDRLWPLAKAWARSHATTPVEVVGERILVTRAPQKPTDISLTVSRLLRGGVERLFLDVSCLDSVSGRRFCASESVQGLRDRFVEAMRNAASTPPPETSVEKQSRP